LIVLAFTPFVLPYLAYPTYLADPTYLAYLAYPTYLTYVFTSSAAA